MARGDYIADGIVPANRVAERRHFFALVAQAQGNLERLRELKPRDVGLDQTQADLSRYSDDMNQLVGVTTDGDALARDMAAWGRTLIRLTDDARERQHMSNVDAAISLADDDARLCVARVERRSFTVRVFLHELLTSLGPMLRQAGHSARRACAEDLVLDSYPGALAQVVTNLVVNASLHAFSEGEPGLIVVAAEPLEGGSVRLTVSDDGCGTGHAARAAAARIRAGQRSESLTVDITHSAPISAVIPGRARAEIPDPRPRRMRGRPAWAGVWVPGLRACGAGPE